MIAYEMERCGNSHAAGIDFDSLKATEQDAVKARARLKYVSTLYVDNAYQEHYGNMKTQITNDYILGTSKFPATL